VTQQISDVGVIKNVGAASHRNVISIDDTPTALTITTNKETIEVYNESNYFLYYGGSGVSDSTGIPIFPKSTKAWANVKHGFVVYLVRASGESGNIRVVEYD